MMYAEGTVYSVKLNNGKRFHHVYERAAAYYVSSCAPEEQEAAKKLYGI